LPLFIGRLERGEHETVQQAALRVQAQAQTNAIILPRTRSESDEHFKMRLACFKPRTTRGKAGTKPPLCAFVLPMAPDEKPKDFEQRMKMQEGTPFVILPRDSRESLDDYGKRLDATGEARMLWVDQAADVKVIITTHHHSSPLLSTPVRPTPLSTSQPLISDMDSGHLTPRPCACCVYLHGQMVPPLLLPRGKHEEMKVFITRLERASTPPTMRRFDTFCPVYLPQVADGSCS